MNYKRVTLLCGHYGSGKTSIAVNMAYDLRRQTEHAAIADLDIVNPYFRTKDEEEELKAAGIRLICSEYAGTNVDVPALPQDIYAILDEPELKTIVDVGGDDRGALALGRLSSAIQDSGDYDMYLVINMYRPLTPDPESTVEIMHEIETAGRIRFTGIINNSNLGVSTTAEDVIASLDYAKETSRLSGLPVVWTSVSEKVYHELDGTVERLLPLRLKSRIFEFYKEEGQNGKTDIQN